MFLNYFTLKYILEYFSVMTLSLCPHIKIIAILPNILGASARNICSFYKKEVELIIPSWIMAIFHEKKT